MIGQAVSHYRVLRRLGEGGMGVLYCAEDVRLGRHVALKFLRDEVARDEVALERFRREARAASSLNNPHICTVHDGGLHEGRPFIVMELLEGATLAERLEAGPLTLGELLDLGVQMADALCAAHGKGVVHRDLKPKNAFLTDGGLLKVVDFGVAKLLPEPTGQTTSVHGLRAALLECDGEGSTPMGLVLGWFPYMSPEQMLGREIDARSDLFSLGAVLFEMATGCRPFAGSSTREVIDAVLYRTPLPPSRLRRGLPRQVDTVILKALAMAPEARYQSAEEMLRSLRSLQVDAERAVISAQAFRGFWREPGAALVAAVARLRRPNPTATDHPSDRIESLAVMPLAALSGGEQEELLADGVTDALIGHLSQIRAVRVISRTSVLRYERTSKAVPEISRELGVDGVVEGSLLLSGGRVRVTARLVRAAEERTVWSRTYDRDVRDVLVLQSELAHAVAREIRVALTPEERRRVVRRRSIDPEAHFSYLRGRFHVSKGSPVELQKALAEFEAAVGCDPTFAPAWAGIGWVYTWLAGAIYAALPPCDAMPRAKAAAQRALEIEPSAEAHAVLGYVAERCELDFTGAKHEFGLALDLDPGSAGGARGPRRAPERSGMV